MPTRKMLVRGEVAWFAEAMEGKLAENDYKTHWSHMSVAWLRRRLATELRELERAIASEASPHLVLREAADVGNFLMMIADNYRREAAEVTP